ncbi:MAG: ferritin-like domain-containing protein, partial [Actinobacteria bacterium]|nr:ferritin-like domain-containing protein [Actinomycetota bacterium]
IDSKFYAANQVADEARHVEAYGRYLNEKLGHSYEISRPLESLLTDIMSEKRWDITYLGMQIMVEGLALAAFGWGNLLFNDPVIKQITDYVMRDEARHVAFGVLSLQGMFDDMTAPELKEREDFVMEAAQLMRDRFLLDQVWERVGVDVAVGTEFANHSPIMMAFRQTLFSKIVPNLNKLGLLTPRVADHFDNLGILELRDYSDTASELDDDLLAPA